MQIEIRIDASCREPKIIVVTDRMTDELSEAVNQLSGKHFSMLAGFQDGTLSVLEESEIINLRKVKGFDLSFSGTIRVALSNGFNAFVSRRYVSKIKEVLGI